MPDDTYTLAPVTLPFPPDTIIAVGMRLAVSDHGLDLKIKRIAVSLCPNRDIAAEGVGEWAPGVEGDLPTAVEVPQIEAALLPYAVFDFGGHWAYGSQVTAIREGDEHEG
jgi:hypothetical protein